jgi:putative flippase GtrA
MGAMAKKKSPAKKTPKNPLLAQFAKFFSVGVSNTLIDLGLFEIISHVFHIPLASAYKVKVFSGTVAMINSFYWNRRWTFQSHTGVAKSGWKFIVTTLASVYLIQPTIVRFFTAGGGVPVGNFWYNLETGIGLHLIPHDDVLRLFAFAMGVVGAGIWDFTLYKLWAFRKD